MATLKKEKCHIFGIELKSAPNQDWYMQGYQEAYKGNLVCNFNKKVTLYGIFDGTCNAKVINWKSTNFIFEFPYNRELLASILFEVEYNFTDDGVKNKTEIYSKHGSKLDLTSYSESFNYEIKDSEINSIDVSTNRDEKNIHILVHTIIYNPELDDIRANNCELLGESPEDAYKEKPEDVKDTYYIDSADMVNDDVQKGEDGFYYVNVHLDESIQSTMFSATAIIWHSKSFDPMPCKLLKLDSALSIYYGEFEDQHINIEQPQLRAFLPVGEIIEAWIVNSYSDAATKSYKLKFVCQSQQTKQPKRLVEFLTGVKYEMDIIKPVTDRINSICVDTTGGRSAMAAALNAMRCKLGQEQGKSFYLSQLYSGKVSAVDVDDPSLQFTIESTVLYDYLGKGETWVGLIDDVNVENQEKPKFKFLFGKAQY